MFDFPVVFHFELAKWIDSGMTWILQNWSLFFDGVSRAVLYVLLNMERLLLWLPWFVVILLIAVSAWWVTRRWWSALLMAAFMFIIGALGLWDLAMMTLAVVISSVILSLLIGIPLGILMARSNLIESFIRPGLDAMQTMPSFVYLIPAMMLFGLGKVPAVVATIIYAMPPVIRLTNVGIRQVQTSVIEASKAFGANWWQQLTEIQMPLAVPSIMVGVNQTTMMALAMVVIASMIGAQGMGMEVLLAIQRIEVGRGVVAGISIVLLAIVIDRITSAFGSRLDYRTRTQ